MPDTIPAFFRRVLQGVDQVVTLTPTNELGQAIVLGLQTSDIIRMELRVTLKDAKPIGLMTSPEHFTIVPAAGGNPAQLLILFKGEETIAWDLPILTSKEADGEPTLDAEGNLTLAQKLFGTIFITDSGGNSRPGSGIPAKFAMIPSFTRTASSVGL